jgi:hypothetical protein
LDDDGREQVNSRGRRTSGTGFGGASFSLGRFNRPKSGRSALVEILL